MSQDGPEAHEVVSALYYLPLHIGESTLETALIGQIVSPFAVVKGAACVGVLTQLQATGLQGRQAPWESKVSVRVITCL